MPGSPWMQPTFESLVEILVARGSSWHSDCAFVSIHPCEVRSACWHGELVVAVGHAAFLCADHIACHVGPEGQVRFPTEGRPPSLSVGLGTGQCYCLPAQVVRGSAA